jgi:glycerol uptake facilitator-like aquaporin
VPWSGSSGCSAPSPEHFNPVLTLIDRAFGAIGIGETGLYIVAQIAGGCLGTVVANLMFDLPAIDVSTKTRSSGALWLSEVVATAGLLLVIHSRVRTGPANVVAVAVAVWIGGAYRVEEVRLGGVLDPPRVPRGLARPGSPPRLARGGSAYRHRLA